jgi:hypothetical protein
MMPSLLLLLLLLLLRILHAPAVTTVEDSSLSKSTSISELPGVMMMCLKTNK